MLELAVPRFVQTPVFEEITEAAGLARLEHGWNDLLESSGAPNLFLSWEWLESWRRHIGGGNQLAIACIWSGEQLVAAAPLLQRQFNLRRGQLMPVKEFLGSGYAGPDYLDIVVRQGWERDAAQLLGAHIAAQRINHKWTGLLRNASFAGRIAGQLSEMGWTVARTTINVCPYISFAGRSWPEYLGSLGAEHRYGFQRKKRKLERDFDVRFEEVRNEAQRQGAIEELFRLHHLRWSEHGQSDALHTRALLDFHREFSERALRQGWLRLYLLRLNGAIAAALYGFLYRDVFHYYQAGFDPAFSKYGIGVVTLGMTIERAIEEGAVEFDFLHGNERYKWHWAGQSRELERIELFPPGAMGSLCHISAEAIRSIRGGFRRMSTSGAGS